MEPFPVESKKKRKDGVSKTGRSDVVSLGSKVKEQRRAESSVSPLRVKSTRCVTSKDSVDKQSVSKKRRKRQVSSSSGSSGSSSSSASSSASGSSSDSSSDSSSSSSGDSSKQKATKKYTKQQKDNWTGSYRQKDQETTEAKTRTKESSGGRDEDRYKRDQSPVDKYKKDLSPVDKYKRDLSPADKYKRDLSPADKYKRDLSPADKYKRDLSPAESVRKKSITDRSLDRTSKHRKQGKQKVEDASSRTGGVASPVKEVESRRKSSPDYRMATPTKDMNRKRSPLESKATKHQTTSSDKRASTQQQQPLTVSTTTTGHGERDRYSERYPLQDIRTDESHTQASDCHLSSYHGDRSSRKAESHVADRRDAEYEGRDVEYNGRDRSRDYQTTETREAHETRARSRDSETAASKYRRGESERVSRRSQWESEHRSDVTPAGHRYSDRSPSGRRVETSPSQTWDRDNDRHRETGSNRYEREPDREVDVKRRDDTRRGADRRDRSDRDRAVNRDRERDSEREKDTDKPTSRGSGRVIERDRTREQQDREQESRDKYRERDSTTDRSRTKEHRSGEQDWDYRHHEHRDRNRDIKSDNSDAPKPVTGRSEHRDSWYHDNKRRRSLSSHDDTWDKRDRKRGRYDDEEKLRDRGQYRDDVRYSRERSPKSTSATAAGYSVSSRQDRLDTEKRSTATDTMYNKLDDKRHDELSAIPVHVAPDDRSRRSVSRSSLGSRTSQRDPRIEPRFDFRQSVDFRGEPRGYRDDRLHDRAGAVFEGDGPFYRGERAGYERPTRIDVDVSRPPPPLPYRGVPPCFELPERLAGREVMEGRDMEWDTERHEGRGAFRHSSRPPNWDRAGDRPGRDERPGRDDWDNRFTTSRTSDLPDRRTCTPPVRDDYRPVPPEQPLHAPAPLSGGRGPVVAPPAGRTPAALGQSTGRVNEISTPETGRVSSASDNVVKPPVTAITSEIETEGSSKGVGDDIGYDDISDDELDDLIGGAEDDKDDKTGDKIAVVDILDIKWESLMQPDRSKSLTTTTSALTRFTAYNIFNNIGISAAFAGDNLIQKIKTVCQQQMNKQTNKMKQDASSLAAVKTERSIKSEPGVEHEVDNNTDPTITTAAAASAATAAAVRAEMLEFLDPVAEFHASLRKKVNERVTLVTNIGQYRRALCARRDLAVRRSLCKVDKDDVVMYPAQAVDPDLYKLSQQHFRQDRDRRPSTVAIAMPQAQTAAVTG